MAKVLRPLSGSGTPHVVVVGAGMVGLSTAWYLQEHGVQVTVIERSGVAAGSSWGNAGWISPGLCVPLSDPSVLKYGLKAVLDPDSPLFIPLKPDVRLASFLLGFARRCTPGQWRKTMDLFVPVNRLAIGAYDELESNGVAARSHEAPIMAAFRRAEDAKGLEHEIELIHEAGLDLEATEVDNATCGLNCRSSAPTWRRRSDSADSVTSTPASTSTRWRRPCRSVADDWSSVRTLAPCVTAPAE